MPNENESFFDPVDLAMFAGARSSVPLMSLLYSKEANAGTDYERFAQQRAYEMMLAERQRDEQIRRAIALREQQQLDAQVPPEVQRFYINSRYDPATATRRADYETPPTRRFGSPGTEMRAAPRRFQKGGKVAKTIREMADELLAGSVKMPNSATGTGKSNALSTVRREIAPQVEAMLLAQRRASLPISGGGKGTQLILPAAERDANLAKMLEGSKVKERLYHGTGRDIKEFDKSKLRRTAFGEGFHLAESPNLANFYANQFDEGQNVMPVHAAIKNPYDLKNMHDWYDVPGNSDKDKTNFLKSQGYDGIKYPHGAGGDKTSPAPSVYVAFEPTQIKSAIGNQGTFDINDPDLSKATGGAVQRFQKGGKVAKTIQQMADELLAKGAAGVGMKAGRGAGLSGVLGGGKTNIHPDILKATKSQLSSGLSAEQLAKSLGVSIEEVPNVLPLRESTKNLRKFVNPSTVQQRVFHGSNNPEGIVDDAQFAHYSPDSSEIHWFTPDPDFADQYTYKYMESPGEQGAIFPAYVQLQNPIEIPFDMNAKLTPDVWKFAKDLGFSKSDFEEWLLENDKLKPERAWNIIDSPQFREAAASRGYDGIKAPEGGVDTFGVFDPRKIKSQFNEGTYDTTTPDIGKKEGGAIHSYLKGYGR